MTEQWLVCGYIRFGKCNNVKSQQYGKDCIYYRDAKKCPVSVEYKP